MLHPERLLVKTAGPLSSLLKCCAEQLAVTTEPLPSRVKVHPESPVLTACPLLNCRNVHLERFLVMIAGLPSSRLKVQCMLCTPSGAFELDSLYPAYYPGTSNSPAIWETTIGLLSFPAPFCLFRWVASPSAGFPHTLRLRTDPGRAPSPQPAVGALALAVLPSQSVSALFFWVNFVLKLYMCVILCVPIFFLLFWKCKIMVLTTFFVAYFIMHWFIDLVLAFYSFVLSFDC